MLNCSCLPKTIKAFVLSKTKKLIYLIARQTRHMYSSCGTKIYNFHTLTPKFPTFTYSFLEYLYFLPQISLLIPSLVTFLPPSPSFLPCSLSVLLPHFPSSSLLPPLHLLLLPSFLRFYFLTHHSFPPYNCLTFSSLPSDSFLVSSFTPSSGLRPSSFLPTLPLPSYVLL